MTARAWFNCFLPHMARKWTSLFFQPRSPGPEAHTGW